MKYKFVSPQYSIDCDCLCRFVYTISQRICMKDLEDVDVLVGSQTREDRFGDITNEVCKVQ